MWVAELNSNLGNGSLGFTATRVAWVRDLTSPVRHNSGGAIADFTTIFKRCQHQNNKTPFVLNGTIIALNS
jgi:hypothetical protein